jgi:hypothetical protein
MKINANVIPFETVKPCIYLILYYKTHQYDGRKTPELFKVKTSRKKMRISLWLLKEGINHQHNRSHVVR